MSTTTITSIELESYPRTSRSWTDEQRIDRIYNEPHSSSDQQEINSLEPTDGGSSAWKLLLGAFLFEAILWGNSNSKSVHCSQLIFVIGFALSFGVFQNYYSRLPEFANNPFIPYVGSISTGISFLGAPIMAPLVKRFPKYQRHMIFLGWPVCILGILAGSFVNTLPGLIMTQGVLYGGIYTRFDMVEYMTDGL